MGQITATRNLVATKVVRHAGQWIILKFVCYWKDKSRLTFSSHKSHKYEIVYLEIQCFWHISNFLKKNWGNHRISTFWHALDFHKGNEFFLRLSHITSKNVFNHFLNFCQWFPWIQFVHVTFENVICKLAAILSRPQCVNHCASSMKYCESALC